MKDLTNLRKIAEAATPGPWKWEEPSTDAWPSADESLVQSDGNDVVLMGWGYDASGTEAEDVDRAHIATFDPQTVLALITRLEQAEASLARVREMLEHHTFVADDKYGDLPASQYYGDSEVEAVAAKSITRALDGEQK